MAESPPFSFSRLLLISLFQIVLIFSADQLAADEIYFTSGYSRTGVVLRETEDSITFQTEMGISTLSREKIDFVDKASPEENRVLRKRWREKELRIREAREARREAERKLAEEQSAKGLIEFEGKWMTPPEKEAIVDRRKRAYEHRRRFEAEQRRKGLVKFQHLWVTPENAEKLSEMEPKIRALHEEITADRRMVGSLRAAMTDVSSFEEAEKFSDRIKELQEKIEENTRKLGEFLERADEIEATSIRYETPEEFREDLTPSEDVE